MLPENPKDKKKIDRKEFNISPSSVETIDEAVMTWIDEKLNVNVTTNKGWKKVPVLWSTAERARQSKGSRTARDASGQLVLPIMTVERTAVVKDPARKGPYWAAVPPKADSGGVLTVARRIKQDKTSNFQNADSMRKRGQLNFKVQKNSNRIVYEYLSVPMPVYIDVTYKVTIWTEYQQQMNEATQPFITESGTISYENIHASGHKFEMTIGQDFTQENNVADMAEDERKFQTSIELKVLGYLLGDGPNQDNPQITLEENFVDVKMPREREMWDEKPGDWEKSKFRG